MKDALFSVPFETRISMYALSTNLDSGKGRHLWKKYTCMLQIK